MISSKLNVSARMVDEVLNYLGRRWLLASLRYLCLGIFFGFMGVTQTPGSQLDSRLVSPPYLDLEAQVRATGHSFQAKLESARFRIEWSPETGKIDCASLVFSPVDLKTGNRRRDRAMLEWLRYPQYPEIRFELESPVVLSEKMEVSGLLVLLNTSKMVSLTFGLSTNEDGNWLTGRTRIDHRDWGLPVIRSMGFLTVDPILEIRIQLHLPFTDSDLGQETERRLPDFQDNE